MSTKMKGVFKGLRYISQIFENEKEGGELQIGLPTDVKHVAHIGSNGPSENPPTWMNEFQEFGSGDTNDKSSTKDPPPQNSTGPLVSACSISDNPSRKQKQSRRHKSSNGLNGSTGREPSEVKPRRNKSSNLETSSRDAINQRAGRQRNSCASSEPESDGGDSTVRRERRPRRKSKDKNSGSGSDTGHESMTENGSDTGECRRRRPKMRNKDVSRTTVSERREQGGKEKDDLSREIGAL